MKLTIARIVVMLFLIGSFQSAPPVSAASPGIPQANSRIKVPHQIELPPIPDNEIDSHISPTLSIAEHRLIRKVMLQLPPEQRYNVVHYAVDGTVHSNYPDLIAATKVYHQVSQSSRAFVDREGELVVAPPGRDIKPNYNCASIPIFRGTGPYREVLSTCNTPYAYSQVALQCNDTTFMAFPTFEQPYAYTGGFSANGTGVDAGFQYSTTYQNWALIIRIGTVQVSYPTRLRCGQTAPIEFYPVSSTLLAAHTVGYTTTGQYQSLTQTIGVYTFQGWSNACRSCVVKRVTSIAQKSPYADDFHTGSYFGYDFVYRIGHVSWSNSLVGFWSGSGSTYYAYSWTANYTGGYRTYPNDATRMYVYFVDSANETDGIDLHH